MEKRSALTLQFSLEVIADPTRLEGIPQPRAVLVILPPDDPEFAAYELAEADRLRAQGYTVVVKQVGVEPITEEGWARLNAPLPAWAPTWATDLDPDRATIVYDRQRDALLVDLAAGARQGWGWPLTDSVYLLLDATTEEAFAYLIPDFVTSAVQQVPALALALRIAEARPLTDAEQGQLLIMHPDTGNDIVPARRSGADQIAPGEVIAAIRRLAGTDAAE